MKLQEINEKNIRLTLYQHDAEGGNLINSSLRKLFSSLNDEANQYEVSIKVAELNQIYSTAIQYTAPVVDKIVSIVDNQHIKLNEEEYAVLVDDISKVSWVSNTSGKIHSRNNMSFCSKYIHFLSGYKLPIYDSYIWIVMVGYLNQYYNSKLSFANPKSYNDFYAVFKEFKKSFDLHSYSNYDIDKYLWQYGKNIIKRIGKKEQVNLDKAKSILKKRITSVYTKD
ncbi:hypothetical protein SIN8267_01850 [Sinobacterium norvegicum]|uniref:Uncharacterized protein n=1 Tax=Sinobacterium norvegicum TaxID=1641715 RepID=A0ABM9AEV7_9GAMM|nr:hypothetical protein [Sinobacterium norvegicum]CAH0991736.1 hypothetical protein SIN8267_01850 [Sinobacterium norvegicum]